MTVSNHQPFDCIFNSCFKLAIKETPKLCATDPSQGNSVYSPHKGPVIWKSLSCHDVIILNRCCVIPRNPTCTPLIPPMGQTSVAPRCPCMGSSSCQQQRLPVSFCRTMENALSSPGKFWLVSSSQTEYSGFTCIGLTVRSMNNIVSKDYIVSYLTDRDWLNIEIRAWRSNYIHIADRHAITYPLPDLNECLDNPTKDGHGLVIATQTKNPCN